MLLLPDTNLATETDGGGDSDVPVVKTWSSPRLPDDPGVSLDAVVGVPLVVNVENSSSERFH